MKYKILPLTTSFIILILSLILTFILKNPLLSQLSFELFVTTAAYFILILSLHVLRPKKINTEKIFLSGLAKPPYIHPDEIYVFQLTRKSETER